jgi:hypothetical protein
MTQTHKTEVVPVVLVECVHASEHGLPRECKSTSQLGARVLCASMGWIHESG